MKSVVIMLLLLPFCVNAATINVTNLSELYAAFSNEKNGDEIVIAAGIYTLNSTALEVNAPNVTVRGATGNRDDVIIRGDAMSSGANIKYIIIVNDDDTDYFILKDLSIGRCGWHALNFGGLDNAGEYSIIDNVRFFDTYEQMIKVNDNNADSTDYVEVKNCLFEYTSGQGPQFYIGGIDAHRSSGWHVHDNTFRNIQSPGTQIAEHAIHIWDDVPFLGGNIIERNLIINCDRGIGLWKSSGGDIVRNNMIYHDGGGKFPDTGIDIADSPDVSVYNNTISGVLISLYCIEALELSINGNESNS